MTPPNTADEIGGVFLEGVRGLSGVIPDVQPARAAELTWPPIDSLIGGLARTIILNAVLELRLRPLSHQILTPTTKSTTQPTSMTQHTVHEGFGDLKTRSDCFTTIEQQLHALEHFSTPAEIDGILVQIRAQLRLLQRKLDHGGSQPL